MAGVAAALATGLSLPDQAEVISSDDIDGELNVPESDKIFHGQASVWVFVEFLHTRTASEWFWDKRGEFYLLIGGVRFPSVGEIFLEKDEVWTCPRPRAIYSEFQKVERAKCELTIEVRERDLIRDDRLMKFNLSQPFLPGTYRKVISMTSSPITLSLIVKLEKNIFCTKAKVHKPITASTSKFDVARKKPSSLGVSRAVPDTSDAAVDPDVSPVASPRSASATGTFALPQPPPLSPKGAQQAQLPPSLVAKGSSASLSSKGSSASVTRSEPVV